MGPVWREWLDGGDELCERDVFDAECVLRPVCVRWTWPCVGSDHIRFGLVVLVPPLVQFDVHIIAFISY